MPFAILLPGVLGWYAVTLRGFGNRKAIRAGLIGGLTFTALMMLAFFFALTDGSRFAVPTWAGAVLAAALAGAPTGWLLEKRHGAITAAGAAALGMALAILAAGLLRQSAPPGTGVPGSAQHLFFSQGIGIMGAIIGTCIGAGIGWLAKHPRSESVTETETEPSASARP